jgi:hypothetical protein
MGIKEIIAGLFKPVADIFAKREERKAAKEAAAAKLAHAKQEGAQQLELNKDEWEQLQVQGMSQTWKDEYVTVSVVSILNLILIGGLAAAFGFPQVLEGVGIALTAITAAGVDIGFLMEAAVLAGLGLSIWKRF